VGAEKEEMAAMGAPALEGEAGYSPLERRWARPTLDANGIVGGFIDEGKKTVIPARAKAKVSMRLVPDQDPVRILAALESYAAELATPGVTVRVRDLGHAKPVRTGTGHPGVAAAARAFRAAFGAEPVLVRDGGTVPVAIDFQEALDPRMLITGFGLPGDALHSPNERFSLDQYHRGTEMVLHLMDELVRA
jgi:acetylornithine deacetylase/succinyl-diaminopimelate desuccinylase-like protein